MCEIIDHPDSELSEDDAEDGEALDEYNEEDIDDGYDYGF